MDDAARLIWFDNPHFSSDGKFLVFYIFLESFHALF